MKCFSVDVCIYSIFCAFLIAITVLVLFLTDCHDSTCVFLIVMLILMYALLYNICVYLSVCEMF